MGERDISLRCRWEVEAELKAPPQLSHPFIPVPSAQAQASLSFRSTRTLGRGVDGFLEAPVPKWVLEFKITHFSKREPPPQAKGEERPFFFLSF